jgi:hypothetical protein
MQDASRPYRTLAISVLPAKIPELARRQMPSINGQHSVFKPPT